MVCFFFFSSFLCTEVVFAGQFCLCGNLALYARKGLFHAHVLPEDGILCKRAATMGCAVTSEELVVASSTVHGRVLVPRWPDQGAGHSRHRPPRALGFPSCGYGGEKGA